MKRLLLFLTLCGLMLCVSCDPEQNSWDWWVKNSTEQTLKLKYPYYSIHEVGYRTFTIAPGGYGDLFGSTAHERTTLHFDDYFKTIVSKYGEDVYWQILSEDDVVLKTWKYSDRDLPDQRFFEESSWNQEQGPGSGFVTTRFLWTFDILPEDIQ